eukprot:CAMPEP_0119013448 /NCGR_PEP_ID=MMETSP1176-20130426/8456_1 /TAXON_ID=265551 /ORGANISM="Synedropsis recta cf, Strain CCMP1620" /LENGTH=210 /DNA_ID=CAMNT_0006966539 /DNA_START=46 /DNA_END=678 /DNA_ORIENTATION=-
MSMITTLFLLLAVTANAFVVNPSAAAATRSKSVALNSEFQTRSMWNDGNNFGKGTFRFYKNFESWMGVFPQEDREAYPEIFSLPKGTYEVGMNKPLGIVFEEIEVGKGVFVQDLVEGGAADRQGKIQKGDILVGVTAIKIVGAKWERRLLPSRPFDFDTVVGAISSNEPKWGCDDVILMFERPGEADSAVTDKFLEFFNPPGDSPWKQRQ